jgi:hypothetical protein
MDEISMSKNMNGVFATDAEVWRYFELEIRTKLKLYKEQLPTEPRFNHNGCPRTELTARMESFMYWNGPEKDSFRRRVKQELPELELAFQLVLKLLMLLPSPLSVKAFFKE